MSNSPLSASATSGSTSTTAKQNRTGGDDLLLAYPDAGHFVNFLIAWRPINTPAEGKDNGFTPQFDPDAWPKVIAKITSS